MAVYSRETLLRWRNVDATASSSHVVQLATYSEDECDATLRTAAQHGQWPPPGLIKRCSVKGIRDALKLALVHGQLHVADLLQPVTELFRPDNALQISVETYNAWISECLEHPDVVTWLLDRGASLEEEITRGNILAIKVLCQLKRYDRALLPLLNAENRRVKAEAMMALEEWSRFSANRDTACDTGLHDRLMAFLVDQGEEYTIRLKAARILGALLPSASVVLDGSLLDHPDQTCRSLAVYCLGLIGDRKAIPTLVKYLDSTLVLCAIEALGSCGSRGGDGVAELLRFATSNEPAIRETTCVALGKRGCPEHAQVVGDLLDDEVPEIRQAAEEALALILAES
eukprot:GEMP01047804.1.p1 GENE.GEMP01047804.1~~GEMP01047804.1.p1  ORF type:complete len:343 (+),score=73.40 GEMP01047804.1:474-1502(+)